MGKMIKAKIGGSEHFLHLSMNALFEMNKEFGNMQSALEAIEGDTEESFKATCSMALILAREAELARRYLGHTPKEMPDENSISRHMTPFEFVELRKAISEAISVGYTQTFEDEEEERDLGLDELRKKERAGN